jgi:hypothetical protein
MVAEAYGWMFLREQTNKERHAGVVFAPRFLYALGI